MNAYAAANHSINDMEAAYLLSILGVSNTIGRIISSVLGTRKWVDSLIINNLALLIAGVITMLLPFCIHFALLSVFSVVFGLCVGKFEYLIYFNDRTLISMMLIGYIVY